MMFKRFSFSVRSLLILHLLFTFCAFFQRILCGACHLFSTNCCGLCTGCWLNWWDRFCTIDSFVRQATTGNFNPTSIIWSHSHNSGHSFGFFLRFFAFLGGYHVYFLLVLFNWQFWYYWFKFLCVELIPVVEQQAGVVQQSHQFYRWQGCHHSCHLPAQKRPPPLNRSGDKMDYRSFIRALKFQNRTRPSADGLLCCRRRYQNSFWRPPLREEHRDSTEIWLRWWCFWLSSTPPLPCKADKG